MCAVAFGQKNLDEFCNANLQFFIIQFFGLSPEAYANISLGASIYDAVDDTLSGLIIDRTRTRWGRIKPYLILPIPLWLIGTVMLFSSPALSPAMKIVWVAFATVLKGLGMSSTSQYFGIRDLDEAKEYLQNQLLRDRLIEISEALMEQSGNIKNIVGFVDAMKVRSSMTLFQAADPDIEVFGKVLDKFYDGKPDDITLRIIGKNA